MRPRANITLGNPFLIPLLLISIGGFGFMFTNLIFGTTCQDNFFFIGFLFSLIFAFFITYKWAIIFERIDRFYVQPLPTSIITALIILQIYIAFTLIDYGAVDQPDARLSAYGSSSIIMINTALSTIFFPIAYFAAKTQLIRRSVMLTFVFSTLVMLLGAPSKSALIGVFFTALLFFFIKYKQQGLSFPVRFLSIKSAVFFVVLLVGQVALLSMIYGQSVSSTLITMAGRAAQNFDIAIYGCMVSADRVSPENFLTYTFLPILKRIDESFFDLDFYNIPQWLLFEALGIPREGRFGYPNDNLFVGLYFGGFGIYAILMFVAILLGAHLYVSKKARSARRAMRFNPLILALIIKIPLLFLSTQEFIGVFVIYTLILMAASTIKWLFPTHSIQFDSKKF